MCGRCVICVCPNLCQGRFPFFPDRRKVWLSGEACWSLFQVETRLLAGRAPWRNFVLARMLYPAVRKVFHVSFPTDPLFLSWRLSWHDQCCPSRFTVGYGTSPYRRIAQEHAVEKVWRGKEFGPWFMKNRNLEDMVSFTVIARTLPAQ